MSASPQVVCRGLRKTHVDGTGRRAILEGLDFEAAPGGLTVVLGPSGCGKSTLLSIIAGLAPPDGGVVTVFGRNLAAISAGARARLRSVSLGFVLQRSHLLPALSVIENVAVPLRILRLSRRKAHARALEALKGVGLENRSRCDPVGLSVGERQRVAVARALVHRPSLILCDEPTAALDAATGADVVRLLRARADDAGATVVVVTHDAALAQAGDRVWRMAGGAIALEPAPSMEPRA